MSIDAVALHIPERTKAGLFRLASASMIGTVLEWYDFAIYNTMAALIFNQVFFPSVDPFSGLLLALSTFAVGYMSRPVGGVVFGRLGDRIGRRAVLVITLVLMGFTTAGIGLLPGYAVIGVWSPTLLVALRFVQGVALGGEWAGAVLLSLEHGRQDRRGLNGSWAQMGTPGGLILATLSIAILTTSLSDANFLSWGWRVPFIGSFVLVMFGLWLRKGVDETPMFKALELQHGKVAAPVGEVLRYHWRPLLIATSCRIGSDALSGFLLVFTLAYVTTVLHQPREVALTAILIGSVFSTFAAPFFGILSDFLGRRSIYGVGAVLGAAFSFLYFPLVSTESEFFITLAVVAGLLIHGMMWGPQASFIAEQFSTRVRYTGASLAYTLSGTVGGGFGPFIIAYLYQRYGTGAVACYVSAALGVSLAAIALAKETRHRPLRN